MRLHGQGGVLYCIGNWWSVCCVCVWRSLLAVCPMWGGEQRRRERTVK